MNQWLKLEGQIGQRSSFGDSAPIQRENPPLFRS
jgi:hypothetical protein